MIQIALARVPERRLAPFVLPVLLFIPLLLAPLAAYATPQDASQATPLADPGTIVTLQVENDAFGGGTDRYYTAGERLGVVLPTGVLPGPVSSLGHAVFGAGSQRLEIDLNQTIFTPSDTQLYDPDAHDRPYAGQLALHFTLIQDTASTRSLLQTSIGVVGPGSLGQSAQNGFHAIIGDTSNKGWRYQLQTEPTLDFLAGRIWRYNLASFGGPDGIGVQALPQAVAQVGNTAIYGQVGGIVRIGQGLDSDFGPSLIQPGLNGTDAYTPTRPFVWYLFGGVVGRFEPHNMLIQGNDFRPSRGVGLVPWQADYEFGAAFILYGVRVDATEVFETPEFHGQIPGFYYGSLTVSARF